MRLAISKPSSLPPVDRFFRSIVSHMDAAGDANGRDVVIRAAHFEGEAAAETAKGADRGAGSVTQPEQCGRDSAAHPAGLRRDR
jgi:hypothetical protein